MGTKNVIEKILDVKEKLPRKQKQLCNYLLENYQDIGILTVKDLAVLAGVGTTTVLRLTKELGYENFYDLRKEFYNLQVDAVSKWDNVQVSFQEQNPDHSFTSYKTLNEVWDEGVKNLSDTLNHHLVENFEKAVDLMMESRKINVFGIRPYKAPATYLDLMLSEFNAKVYQLSNDSDSLFDRAIQFQKDEVLILFGFEPYTKRTIQLAEIAAEKNVPIILFTDQLSCPIVPQAAVVLHVAVSQSHYSILPVFALVEALVLEIGKRTSPDSIRTIKELVSTLKSADVVI
ncbi:MurR/RpiR family transcriptional regulator [Planomicrobium sp. CPCC 101079]|uniref:MurR/RpiR family transcriptional regulator n=1 Tax=Planomicrobium sp. CPCC 101079 TaxID=2599618 RepID=UPI0011B7614E|nr:MurR/RpiR family transcriptional regulator [Planomicrobium sp. CPCC 101079]TWT01549.1 MurR/RpiR family transcriptional regulator [Planomicrobium sp. CPCC 101079]